MRKAIPIFYNALLLTGVNLLLRFVSTSFQVFVSAQIGAAGVGLLQLVLSVGAMSVTAGMAGVRTTTMYLTAEELGKKRPQNVRWILRACFLFSILAAGTVAMLLYFFAPQIAEGWIGDERTASALRLYACFLPITCLCGVMTGYFTAANRIGTLAAVEVAEQALSLTITMGLLTLWAENDPVKACLCIIFGSGLGNILTLVTLLILRALQKNPYGSPIPVRSRLLRCAVPLALADDLKAGISTTENLMVPKRLALFAGDMAPLAAFGTVSGMVFPVLMFPAAILFALAELLIPELARCDAAGSRRRIRYLTGRTLKVALLYGLLCGGILYLLSEPLCLSLYGSPGAARELRRYALLAPMLYCDAMTDAMTKGLGQQTACVRYNIFTSSLDVLFLYLLLPRYGMDGYFFSFLITHLINFLLSLRRLLNISGRHIRLSRPLLSCLCTVLAAVLAGFAPHPAVRTVAFPMLLGCLLTLCGVIGKADIKWLQGLLYTRTSA
ncbi:MAG: polysaccharide biosynthesis C-terminal domain-containing protein [Oscillospiraceae bacterium]|nr:polysaccharide biosynthesis C-terminal domain-containing protein [Oscillospiraceae bacterium]